MDIKQIIINNMTTQIKTQENDAFCQRIQYNGGKNSTPEEIIQAVESFQKIMDVCTLIKRELKFEDIEQFYNIEIYHIEHFTADDVKAIYEQNMARIKNSKTKRNWSQNELRIFVWIIFSYSQAKHLQIQKFGESDWELITKAFLGKTIEDIKFQWMLLGKSSNVSAAWTQQQDEIIVDLMNQPQYHNRWIDIAKTVFQSSGYFRKPKQCRQRWKNYLNPNIEKGQWLIEQDKNLFELVLKNGKKWSIISKSISTRTQHAVKNRYKSLLKKFKKDHSIRQKSKTSKGLHSKQLQHIKEIIIQLKQKLALFGGSNKINQFCNKLEGATKIQTCQGQLNQSIRESEKEQSTIDRFYPISPGCAWKYYERSFPTVLTIIQSPRILTPQIISPAAFRFPAVAMWEDETAKLFYS